MNAPQVGDVITTVEQLDALPRGAITMGDEAGTWPTPWLMIGSPRGRSGLKIWDDLNSDGNQPLRTSTQVLERNQSVTVVFIPGRPPRPERVVKAEALRDVAALIEKPQDAILAALIPMSPVASDVVAWVLETLHAEADRIEAGETA